MAGDAIVLRMWPRSFPQRIAPCSRAGTCRFCVHQRPVAVRTRRRRFLLVFRRPWNRPRRVRLPRCVKPRKSTVSGLHPRRAARSTAKRPHSRRRVFAAFARTQQRSRRRILRSLLRASRRSDWDLGLGLCVPALRRAASALLHRPLPSTGLGRRRPETQDSVPATGWLAPSPVGLPAHRPDAQVTHWEAPTLPGARNVPLFWSVGSASLGELIVPVCPARAGGGVGG